MPTSVLPVIYDKGDIAYTVLVLQNARATKHGERRPALATIAGGNERKSHVETAIAELFEETLGTCAFMGTHITDASHPSVEVIGSGKFRTFIYKMKSDNATQIIEKLQIHFKTTKPLLSPKTDTEKQSLLEHFGPMVYHPEGSIKHRHHGKTRKRGLTKLNRVSKKPYNYAWCHSKILSMWQNINQTHHLW